MQCGQVRDIARMTALVVFILESVAAISRLFSRGYEEVKGVLNKG